ncbi:hypothetical protein CQW23_06392 [Capsicum baccatum]|uniref:NB-ARC domain-containing protein n=1 Tax=Capsicum baccatum TaxID=33114 RepID=A0A2G2X3A2_CAPBA|nr:hypothetical protein CQW23_06392 [Capsicum baccatum]
MVGHDDQRKRMVTELMRYGGSSGELKVIPIVGMGGIGKTTLAKEVYNDESIRLHFNVHSWSTVSQKRNLKEILLSLLRCAKGENFYRDSEADLADMLQKSLRVKRYLIVLDDMWDSEKWNAVRLFFPSENNGSRILLTTCNTEVACSAGTGSLSWQMDLMGTDESWNLFESIAFSNDVLPSQFKIIRKQIVDKCHWLPLSIAVVARLLKSKDKRLSGILKVKKLCGSLYDYGLFQESILFNNLFHLHQLETLSFEVKVLSPYEYSPLTIPNAKAFRATLKKLKLINTCLSWEDLNIIGELSNLEVLKLKYDACLGDEWHPIEGGFPRLKVLQLYESELKYWKSTNENFPILERLIITSCSELDELPIEFAEINSLRLIVLKWCDPKLEDSAARIQQEQEDLGNKTVDVHIVKKSKYKNYIQE